jgi:hypothetical protein
MRSTMPRLTTSSAISRWVQCVMGRPDWPGASQAMATMAQICSAVIVDAEFGQGDRLQEHPTFAPASHRVEGDLMRLRDGRVALPVGGVQDDLGPQDRLLGGRMPPDEALEGLALLLGHFDGQGFGTAHNRLRARRQVAGSRQIRQSLYHRPNSAKMH